MLVSHLRLTGRCSYRVLTSPVIIRHASGSTSTCPTPTCPAFMDDSGAEKCLMEPNALDPTKPQPSVVIVGAGIAGLSAAQRLAYCGLTNFVILEATDRPGGRIHSCWLGDTVVELGAQWVLGASPANSVFSLAAREGVLEESDLICGDARMSPRFVDPIFVTSDGRSIDAVLARAAMSSFSVIESQVRSLYNMGTNRPRGSLMDFAENRIKQEVLRFPEYQRYDTAKVMHAQLSRMRVEAGASLQCISADQLGSSIIIPGGDVRVPMGHISVLSPLLRDLPGCSVRYCKVVENIRWAGGGGQWGAPRSMVRCCDGEEFPADYVIVTISLGCLKKSLDCLFCPNLPVDKVEAIRNLGMGSINKIFLEYKRPFWALGKARIALAWSPDEIRESHEWVKGITSIEEVPGSRCLLCVTVVAEDACCIEGMSDSSLADCLTRSLRKFIGDPSIPFPDYMLRSRWTTDPYIRGAKSFLALDSTVGQQCDLATPLPDYCGADEAVLLFAGEATAPGHFGTTHGARLSGLREAERVLALARKRQGSTRAPC